MYNALLNYISENINLLSDPDIFELQKHIEKTTSKIQSEVELFVLCYLDLLPYSPMGIHYSLNNTEEIQNCSNREFLLSHYNINMVQFAFNKFFYDTEKFNSHWDMPEFTQWLNNFPKDKQEFCNYRKQNRNIQLQTFGDSIVFYAPFSYSKSVPDFIALWRIVQACATTMFCVYSQKIFFNGCIHIGLGEELPDGGIYGSVLAQAVKITENIKFPSVLISSSFEKFLNEENKYSNTIIQLYQAYLKSCIFALSKKEHDSDRFVDYLGKENSYIISSMGIAPKIKKEMYCHLQQISNFNFYNYKSSKMEIENQDKSPIECFHRYVMSEKERWQ